MNVAKIIQLSSWLCIAALIWMILYGPEPRSGTAIVWAVVVFVGSLLISSSYSRLSE